MTLPPPLETLWNDMQAARRDVLHEARGLSQAQLDWRPAEAEWSIGEVCHHLMLAEVATGKLATNLFRKAEAAGGLRAWPAGVELGEQMRLPKSRLPGPAPAPPHIWPQHALPAERLFSEIDAARGRTRQSLERLGSIDPRAITWEHFALGPMHLGQWFALVVVHDRLHVDQIRAVKAAAGFPTG